MSNCAECDLQSDKCFCCSPIYLPRENDNIIISCDECPFSGGYYIKNRGTGKLEFLKKENIWRFIITKIKVSAECVKCSDINCLVCSDIGCTQCSDNYFLHEKTHTCISSCDESKGDFIIQKLGQPSKIWCLNDHHSF